MFPVYVECRGYADNLDGTIGTGSKDECCDFYSAESVGSDGERAWTIEGGASYFSSSASAFHDSSGRYELVLVLRLLICCAGIRRPYCVTLLTIKSDPGKEQEDWKMEFRPTPAPKDLADIRIGGDSLFRVLPSRGGCF